MSSKTTPMPTLTKPTLSKSQAANFFAEGGKSQAPDANVRRVFFAPEGYRRLTINLPVALHKKLRVAAIERDCTATEIIERLLNRELEGV